MNMKRVMALCMSALLCSAVSGCGGGKEPDPAKLQTPQYKVSEPAVFKPPSEDEIHTADKGVRVIGLTAAEIYLPDGVTPVNIVAVTPDTVWDNDATVTWNAFTMPEQAALEDGSIGELSIPKIGLTVKVYESDDQMEDMKKGAAHFKSTSAWDGNVCLSAHNWTASGQGAYFRDLYMLSVGDTLIYRTALGEREYRVTMIKTISDEDWSALSRTTDNLLTLITCVNNNPSKRLLIQGAQA